MKHATDALCAWYCHSLRVRTDSSRIQLRCVGTGLTIPRRHGWRDGQQQDTCAETCIKPLQVWHWDLLQLSVHHLLQAPSAQGPVILSCYRAKRTPEDSHGTFVWFGGRSSKAPLLPWHGLDSMPVPARQGLQCYTETELVKPTGCMGLFTGAGSVHIWPSNLARASC
eukprot:4034644-Amphidinium_carterae.1